MRNIQAIMAYSGSSIKNCFVHLDCGLKYQNCDKKYQKVARQSKIYFRLCEVLISFFHRSLFFVYESDQTVKDIKLYRFTAPEKLYLNGDTYKPNKGFCMPSGCLPTGLLNISRCQPLSKSKESLQP